MLFANRRFFPEPRSVDGVVSAGGRRGCVSANYVVLVCVCVRVACCLSHYRPLITHSCRHLRLVLLACARWVGGWVGARKRESGGCRRLITAAIKPWLALWCGAATRARRKGFSPGLLQMKEARARAPNRPTAAEEKRNFQMKGRDFICPLIKCRWLPVASQIKVALASLCDLRC
jgi:hypothetical protein